MLLESGFLVRIVSVTGAASGMGKATADRLRSKGGRVIGASRKGAEIESDIGTAKGRAHMVGAAERLVPEGLDGVLVACAGTLNHQHPGELLALNYFGAAATLERLVPLLARSVRPRAVVVSSTVGILATNRRGKCLAGGEAAAMSAGATSPRRPIRIPSGCCRYARIS